MSSVLWPSFVAIVSMGHFGLFTEWLIAVLQYNISRRVAHLLIMVGAHRCRDFCYFYQPASPAGWHSSLHAAHLQTDTQYFVAFSSFSVLRLLRSPDLCQHKTQTHLYAGTAKRLTVISETFMTILSLCATYELLFYPDVLFGRCIYPHNLINEYWDVCVSCFWLENLHGLWYLWNKEASFPIPLLSFYSHWKTTVVSSSGFIDVHLLYSDLTSTKCHCLMCTSKPQKAVPPLITFL